MIASLHAQVERALNEIHDPCSIASNAPLGLIDMGLVREWHIDGPGDVTVLLCTTGPGCMMAGNILRATVERLEAIEGIGLVSVDFDAGFVWTPAHMSAQGAARLATARDRAASVRPQMWRERA